MVEPQKYTARKGFQSANAKFMGLADEPKTGVNENGNPYRLIKMNWHLDGREKQNKFTMWTPLGDKSQYKSDSDLKQFHKYNIVWVEEDKKMPNGNEWVDKKIVIITDEEPAPVITESFAGVAIIAQDFVSEVESLRHWDSFQKSYIDLVPVEKRSVNHMFGTYLKTHYSVYFSKLIERCKDFLGKSG